MSGRNAPRLGPTYQTEWRLSMRKVKQSDVEVYLRDCSLEAVVAWVKSHLGPLDGPIEADKTIVFYPRIGSVVITPNIEGGPFLSLWFNTVARPWATDVDCARVASRELSCVVRCDPGESFPNVPRLSSVLLEISNGSERLVSLEE